MKIKTNVQIVVNKYIKNSLKELSFFKLKKRYTQET